VTVRFRTVSLAKRTVKLALLVPATLGREREAGLYVLIYHRVGAGMGQEMDLPVATFRRQMEFLTERFEVVRLSEGVARIQAGALEGDLAAVSFDDGYGDVYTRAWPVLAELRVPATLFLATGFLEGDAPAPIRAGARGRGEPPRALSWAEVREMLASGLVDVGSHSHTHAQFDRLSAAQAAGEIERSNAILADRLAVTPEGFAYPRAVEGNEAAVAAAYRWAVAGVGAKNVGRPASVHRLSRTPVRASDGMFFFRRRLAGMRPLEDRLYERLRKAR